jgi:PiT family inorganic phosphate transporter
LGGIASGWITTPIIAGIITFISLFFLQNVFNQEVNRKLTYEINNQAIEELKNYEIDTNELLVLKKNKYSNQSMLLDDLKLKTNLKEEQFATIIEISEQDIFFIDPKILIKLKEENTFSENKINALFQINSQSFIYKWELKKQLAALNEEWKIKPITQENKTYNKKLKSQYEYLFNTFRVKYSIEN